MQQTICDLCKKIKPGFFGNSPDTWSHLSLTRLKFDDLCPECTQRMIEVIKEERRKIINENS